MPWLKPTPWPPGAQGPSCPLSQDSYPQQSQMQPPSSDCHPGTLRLVTPGWKLHRPPKMQPRPVSGDLTPPRSLESPCSGRSPHSRSRATHEVCCVGTAGHPAIRPYITRASSQGCHCDHMVTRPCRISIGCDSRDKSALSTPLWAASCGQEGGSQSRWALLSEERPRLTQVAGARPHGHRHESHFLPPPSLPGSDACG